MKSPVIIQRVLLLVILFSVLCLVTPASIRAESPFAVSQGVDTAQALQPANPNASENAKRVLNYLDTLPNRQENRVIAGQHLNYHIKDAAGGYNDYVKKLYNSTGKWVGIIGLDYGFGSTCGNFGGKPDIN